MSRWDGLRSLTTVWPIRMSPAVCRSSPATQPSVVVLPQPDGPSMTKSSPSSIVSSRSPTATVPSSKRLCRWAIAISAMGSAADGTEGEAGDEVFPHEEGEREDGRREDHRRRCDEAPVDRLAADELRDRGR